MACLSDRIGDRGASEALDTVTAQTRICPTEKLPELYGALARAQAIAMARLIPPAIRQAESEPQTEDRLLNTEEAATVLGVSKSWLYRNGPTLPFALRISTGRVRFSKKGIERWIKRRTAG
jgi:predicted DNA-binding transcriptional regulator AlpA